MVMLFVSPRPILAAQPTNDVCEGAEVIPSDALFPYWTAVTDISEATTINDPPPPSCQSFVARSIWYAFTPSTMAFYTISSCLDAPTATTVADTAMGIYTSAAGCNGPFTLLEDSESSNGCNDDSCGPGGFQASITTQLNADTTYYIVVWEYADSLPPPGPPLVQIYVNQTASPPNDLCAFAPTLELNTPRRGTTIGANNNYQLAGSSCFVGLGNVPSGVPGRDVVYTFTAPVAGSYNFRVENFDINNNLVVYVTRTCPTGASPSVVADCLGAANRSPVSSVEEVTCVALACDERVFIFVDENTLTPGSSFTIAVTPCVREAEPNNSPTNANRVACGIVGTISPKDDLDYYALGTFPAGSRAFVLVDGEAAKNSTRNFDLRITASTNTLEFDDEDNDLGFGTLSPNVAGTPLTSEPAYVRVSFSSAGGGAAAEPYHVYAVIQPPLSAATPEVAETAEDPDPINEASNNYYYGTLTGPAPSTDNDLFSLAVNAGDLIFVSLDGDPLRDNTPIDGKLELLGSNGEDLFVILQVNDPNEFSSTNSSAGSLNAFTPSAPGEGLVYRAVDDGTVYIRVSIGTASTNRVGAGDYLLSISTMNCVGANGPLNAPPAIAASTSVTTPIAEGRAARITGSITDPDAGDTHSVSIRWGDGVCTTLNLVAGETNFVAWHIFPPDAAANTLTTTSTIKLTLTDYAANRASASFAVVVTNAPPGFSNLLFVSSNITNGAATLTGGILEPGELDSLTLTVNWGDGSPLETVQLPAGSNFFSLPHTYSPGATNRSVQLTVADDDGGLGAATTIWRPERADFRGISHLPDGHIRLQLQGTPHASYRVLVSADLQTWNELPGSARRADENGLFEFEDTQSPLSAQKFYRAVWP